MSRAPGPYPPELRRQMVELVRSGRSPEDLAREYEPSASTIRGWVRSAAREPDRGRPTPLPEVTEDTARRAREALERHRFVPSSLKLPDSVLPDTARIRVIDQGSEGVSVGVALAAVLNYLRAGLGDLAPVSARMLYEYAKLYDEWRGRDHEGSSLLGGLAGLVAHGVCLDSQWPLYEGDGALAGPGERALAQALSNRPAAVSRVDRSVEQLRAAVFEAHAVAVAAMVHGGWRRPERGVIAFPPGSANDGVIGGHAFAVVGFTPEGFIVQNSWGTGWGGGPDLAPGTAVWRYEDAGKNLTDAWVIALSAPAHRIPLVGYDSDGLTGEDLLEIGAEVTAFAYVLASRSIRPPLALGLFGDWGSGKSFFMQEMQRKIESLAHASSVAQTESPFCERVVQIRFNAWHYLDTDLWASLVTEIFDRLFEAIGGGTGKPEEQLPRLARELEKADGVYRHARRQLADAMNARNDAEKALARAIVERERTESAIATQLDDLGTLLRDSPRVRSQLDTLSVELGLPNLKRSYDAVAASVGELGSLGGRARALAETLYCGAWQPRRVLLLATALCAPILVVLALEWLRRSFAVQLGDFQSLAMQVSALLASAASWLGSQLRRGGRLLSSLEATHAELEGIRERRRAEAVAGEAHELQALREAEEAARASVRVAEQRVQALRHEIDELQPGRLITRFIEERSRSSDYRARLGIVSLVRRDFERLSELADPASMRRDRSLMPIERIILYIDDLDRCRPDRVVDVLEAVHLLLAFPLFMVVVAVDPRWLRRCLEKHYPDLLAPRIEELPTVARTLPARPSTAQDYLEKIFQIPFTLQTLRADGYRRLVRGLTERNRMPDSRAPLTGAQTQGAPPSAVATAEDEDSAGRDAVLDAGEIEHARRDAHDADVREDAAASVASAVERLRIRAWELDDIERLAPLFDTPRAVKRFVNTYRFLRAGVPPHELAQFEGTRESPGTYRGALLLLAVVVSYSNVGLAFLQLIVDVTARDDAPTAWPAFLHDARAYAWEPPESPDAGDGHEPPLGDWQAVEWRTLCDALLALSSDGFPVGNVAELRDWVPVVARYSFSLRTLAHS